jgi:uncharacterized phage protein (TIGR02220 family)
VNFYKHFIGDYQRDTMHLTMVQDGAYRRLLDACYATERPLPADPDACYRLSRAFSKDEREATDFVLNQFFPVGADGFRHNNRSDKEIAHASAYADAQSMRAHKRWDKQTDMQGHKQAQCPNDASHSHSQTPEPVPEKSKALSGKAPDVDPLAGKNGKANHRAQASEVLAFLNEKAGRRYRESRPNMAFIEARLREGATVTECRQVIVKKCREWLNTEQALYLRPATLFNATKFSQYQGELVAPDAIIPRETSAALEAP